MRRAAAAAVVVDVPACRTAREVLAEYDRRRKAGETRQQAALVIEQFLRRQARKRPPTVDRKLAAAGREVE